MSKISTAYDYLVTKMGTVFPSHVRMSNPYDLSSNVSRIMEQAWGIAVGPATTQRELCPHFSTDRTFRMILSRKFIALENDPVSKSTAEKLLLEDHYALLNAFEADITLGANIIKFIYQADNGIEFVFSEKDPYLFISSDFNMEYIETVT